MRDKVFVIAEAANNHGGSLEKAMRMVEVAKEAGADAVKFQYLDPPELCGPDYPFRETFERVALAEDDWPGLKDCCDDIGVEFMATPFSLRAVDYLDDLGMERIKISSGDITFVPLLERIAELCKPVYLSTGMASAAEIRKALQVLEPNGGLPVTLLKCTVSYPCKDEDVNLEGIRALKYLAEPYDGYCTVGLSDHTSNGLASVLAVASGATAIEKHFYLDDDPKDGSVSPSRLRRLVNKIRRAETIMGEGELGLKDCERDWKPLARRDPTTWRRE